MPIKNGGRRLQDLIRNDLILSSPVNLRDKEGTVRREVDV